MIKLKTGARKYLTGAVLGLLSGTILYFVQPVKWQGQVLIKIGQFTQNQNFVESAETVIERLKSNSFIQAAAERAKRPEIVKLLSPDKDNGMAIRSTKNGELLIIYVKDSSAELVQDSLNAIGAELIYRHNAIVNAYQADIRKELAKWDVEQNVLSKRLAMISEGNASKTGFDVMVTQHDLEYVLNRSSQLRESISSANIRPTSLIEDTVVTKKRIFSTLWRACLFGVLTGIFITAIWIRWGKEGLIANVES